MISIFNHKFSTPSPDEIVTFPRWNAGQLIEHSFDIAFNYDFNSTATNQFIISQENQLKSVGGLDFTTLGLVAGDDLGITAVITGGTDIDVSGIVQSVTSDTITFTTDIFASGSVNEMFPMLDNQQMFIENKDRSIPESIDVFYNLIQNSVSGSNQSLWDGEVIRLSGAVPSTDSTVTLSQLGDKSGGFIYSSLLILDTGVYTVKIGFIPWLFIEQNDLTEPSWYQGNEALKPRIDIRGYSQQNNPNAFIEGIENSILGNNGWYEEYYNQGTDIFEVKNVALKDENNNPINQFNPLAKNLFSFEVESSSGTIDENIQLSIFSILPNNTKNNALSRLDNSLYSYFSNTFGVIYGQNNGAFLEFKDIVISKDLGVLTVTGELDFTGDLSLLEGTTYRLGVNVHDDVTGVNVTKIVNDGVWTLAEVLPVQIPAKTAGFLNHAQIPTDSIRSFLVACTEDDFLYKSVFELDKNEAINNVRIVAEVTRASDGVLIANLFERIFDFSNVVFLNGKYILNETQNIPQFLDSQGRNEISLKLNGTEDSNTYEVELLASLMSNWRDWVALQNFEPDFYDNTLPSNGQSAEWVNYYRFSTTYNIMLKVQVNQPNAQLFFENQTGIFDYDFNPSITSTIELLDEDDNVVTEIINNKIYTVRATHELEGEIADWTENVWGWIGLRPKQGEPMKRISTVYDVTQLNAPLEPLTGQTKAKLTFPTSRIAVVECKVNSSFLSNESTFVARIDDTSGEQLTKMNVTKIEIQKINANLTRRGKDESGECCGEPWLVLADPQDSTTWKNDHTLIFEKATSLTVTTVHNGVESPALGVAVNFPNDSLTKGFVIDWRLYYDGNNELIQGQYDVYVEFTVAGQTVKYFSNAYKLLKYSDFNAEGTIRIATIFNKYSELYDTDFSGSGARDSLRLRGFFGYRQPNYETKNNTELSKKRNNVFRKSNNTYQLIIEPTVECKTQRVEQLHLLHASECYISDFNEFNHYGEILELPVILSDENSPEFDYFEGIGTKYARVLAEFKDKVSRRKSKNNGTGEQADIPNIGLWEGAVAKFEGMTVDFVADKIEVDIGEEIQFTDLSDKNPTNWTWNFNNEGDSLVQNPIFSFLTEGLKTVYLMAGRIDAGGVLVKTDYINVLSPPDTDFVIRVKTDNAGTSNDDQFTLPTFGSGYDYTIDWGDGTIEDITTDVSQTHTYDEAGEYTIRISGTFPRILTNSAGDYRKIIETVNYGNVGWISFINAFRGCENHRINALANADFSGVTSFNGAWEFNPLNVVPSFNFSLATSFRYTFANTLIASFPATNFAEGLDFNNCWARTELTSFSGCLFPKATSMVQAFAQSKIVSFGATDFPLCTSFSGAFLFCLLDTFGDCDMSNGTDFSSAFRGNDVITSFDTRRFYKMTNGSLMFFQSTLSTSDYSDILITQEANNINDNVVFHGGSSKYNTAGGVARAALIARGWTITDGGPE
jgi:PKD repeat protein